MPTYDYACTACPHRLEAFQWVSEPRLTTCPFCGKESLERLIGAGTAGIVKGTPTTFGQQAELNARRVGREQMRRMVDEDHARVSTYTGTIPAHATPLETTPATPWFRDGSVPGLPKLSKPIDLAKVPDVKRYVETGT